MKAKLALALEWAWSQGQIKSAVDLENFSATFAEQELFSKYPKNAHGHFNVGAREVFKDASKIFRVLSYGGRSWRDVPSERKDRLRSRLAA